MSHSTVLGTISFNHCSEWRSCWTLEHSV